MAAAEQLPESLAGAQTQSLLVVRVEVAEPAVASTDAALPVQDEDGLPPP